MLYNINISQIALTHIGVNGLDYTDLAIFNAVEYMCASNNITKQVIKSKQYSLISWKLIVKQLPFLQHSSRATIKNRIKKLEEAGLIEASPENVNLQNSFYCMGSLYDDYKIKKEPPQENEQPVQKIADPSKKSDGTVQKMRRHPVQKMRRNNNINNNNIKDNIYKDLNENFDHLKDAKKSIELIEYVNENLPQVSKMKRKLSVEEADKLIATYGYQSVKDMFCSMENNNQLLKKYTWAYMTCLNWLKRGDGSKSNEEEHYFDDYFKGANII